MNEHHRLTPVEFRVKRLEIRMADILVVDAGEQSDAVEVQFVQRPAAFGDGGVDIRQRQKAEPAEAPRVILRQSRQIVVAPLRQGFRLVDVAVPDAGRREGQDGCGNGFIVHDIEAVLRRPVGKAAIGRAGDAGAFLRLDVKFRQDVMMHVDASVCGHDFRSLCYGRTLAA